MVLDIPVTPDGEGGKSSPAEIKLLAVDYERDLSLVRLNVGPLPYAAPVAAREYGYGRNVVSAGYDHMEGETVAHVTILAVGSDRGTTYTRERPIPGRSGGGLLDLDNGRLVGVVQGYELAGQRRGMYVSLSSVLAFLGKQGWGEEKRTGLYQLPPFPLPQRCPT
jgi:hypothetical protein